MKARVENLAQKAISLFIGVNGMPSYAGSSSARSNQQTSYLSGSYDHLSTQPTSQGLHSHSHSDSRSTINRSLGLPANLSSTPTGNNFHRRTASSPGPSYLNSQLLTSDYLQLTSPRPNRQPSLPSYAPLPVSDDSYVGNNFNDTRITQSGELFPMGFNSTAFGPYDTPVNMNDGEFQLADSSMGPVQNVAASWQQIDTPRHLQYEHRQR